MPRLKTTARTQSPPADSRGVDTDVEEAILRVRRYYEVGVRSRSETPDKFRAGGTSATAKAVGFHPEKLRSAMKFAERFSAKYLEQFFALCRKHHFSPVVAHITPLVEIRTAGVPAGFHRSLMQDLVRNAWSTRRLRREIKKRFGIQHPHAGRKPAPVASPEDAYVDLLDIGTRWQRWMQRLASPDAKKPGCRLSDLSAAIGTEIEKINQSFAKIKRLAEARLEAHRSRKR